MADAWPETLPQCLLIGYSEKLGDNLAEYQPDIGPPISRRRSSAAVRPLSGAMRMTRAQIAILETFFEVTLDQGALPFTFPDPRSPGDELLVKFAKGSAPSWQQAAPGVYRVTLDFSVLP
jgi:hypothetical protein